MGNAGLRELTASGIHSRRIRKAALIAILLLTVYAVFVMLGTENAYAELPAQIDSEHYITALRLKQKGLKVYKDATLTKKTGTAYADEYQIISLTDKAAQVIYQENNKRKKGWVYKKAFFVNVDYEPLQSYAYDTGFTIYRDQGLTQVMIWVPSYKGGLTVGYRNGKYQVMFYVGDHYYMGWISAETYQKKLRFSMTTRETVLANGYYRIDCPVKAGYALCWNSKKKTVTLEAADANSKYQKFYICSVTGDQFAIQTYNRKYYVGISQSGKLMLTKDRWLWQLSRSGSYIGITDVSSGKALQLKAKARTKMADVAENSVKQQWNFSKVTVGMNYREYTVFSQYDPKWGGTIYAQRGDFIRTISTSGCGVVAYVNAIYALNGQFITPSFLSQYSNANGHYWFNQGTADTLYAAFARDYGSRYHFRYAGLTKSFAQMCQHIMNGGTVVTLVPGHYMAIVDYDPKTDKYMLLDSAITGSRPTKMTGDWVTVSQLQTGRLRCEHFHLFGAV